MLAHHVELFAFVPAFNVRVDDGRFFARQIAIRTQKSGLTATRSTRMPIQGLFLLEVLRTYRANVFLRIHFTQFAAHLDRASRLLRAAFGQVTAQVTRRRVPMVAEVAAIPVDVTDVGRRCCNR